MTQVKTQTLSKLTVIQNELKAPKNQYNTFGKYKYRNCEDILMAVKPILLAHECTLTLTDELIEAAECMCIKATAIFNDGTETIKAVSFAGININKKGMDISQSFGSSTSYARKYALNALLLIDDTKDADTQPENKPIDKKVQDKAKLQRQVLQALKVYNGDDKEDIQQMLNEKHKANELTLTVLRETLTQITK